MNVKVMFFCQKLKSVRGAFDSLKQVRLADQSCFMGPYLSEISAIDRLKQSG